MLEQAPGLLRQEPAIGDLTERPIQDEYPRLVRGERGTKAEKIRLAQMFKRGGGKFRRDKTPFQVALAGSDA
jgi:hypothetical protein